eukprot:scaffold834_cov123-Cylindrotheca_fusiformis.AAC.17
MTRSPGFFITTTTTHANDFGPSTGSDTPVHVLYTLCGNDPDFIDEFSASMKSSLLNCPIDRGMTIHIMADDNAYQAIIPILTTSSSSTTTNNATRTTTKLDQWITRNPIQIQAYNVEQKLEGWKRTFERTTKYRLSDRHTTGAIFRLFAYETLPSDVEFVIYMDTDVAMLANLQDLWRLRNSTALFQWGKALCSGFVLLNLRQIRQQHSFWDMVDNAYPKDAARTEEIDDQHIFRMLTKKYPHLVSFLPSEWDLHRADNFWMWKGNHDGAEILKNRPKAGMVHMNGWTEGEGNEKNKFVNSYHNHYGTIFAAVNYYGNHPWEWTRYMLESQIPDDRNGYPITLGFQILAG